MRPHVFAVRAFATIGLLMVSLGAACQSEDKENKVTLDLQMMTRGEIRSGGLSSSEDPDKDNKSNFVIERERLIVGYERFNIGDQKPWLQMKLNIQHQGVWGQSGKGSINVYEGWAKLAAKNGLFAQVGRQMLAYDDERIIGSNDWAMAGSSHDALKLGYEGYGHKAHAILAYNQNAENVNGGTYYANGAQPYKTMQTFWYHYDVAPIPLSASVLFMNVGMQGGSEGKDERTEWQQMLGGYVQYSPKLWSVEASYYRQMGKEEHGIKIKAWMGSVKAQVHPSSFYGFEVGYDYLSGDKYFAVPPKGGFGLVQHNVIRGFNPIYGSHHKFYGAMDFFYVSTYVNGFTPGLQNAFAGANYKPFDKFTCSATYHYLAVTTKLHELDRTLGHSIDIQARYQFSKGISLSAGYTQMHGTETMARLKQDGSSKLAHWGWFSLVVSPSLFTTKW